MTVEHNDGAGQTETDPDLNTPRRTYPAWVSALTLLAFLSVAYVG
jgi:hypothetical protein